MILKSNLFRMLPGPEVLAIVFHFATLSRGRLAAVFAGALATAAGVLRSCICVLVYVCMHVCIICVCVCV